MLTTLINRVGAVKSFCSKTIHFVAAISGTIFAWKFGWVTNNFVSNFRSYWQ